MKPALRYSLFGVFVAAFIAGTAVLVVLARKERGGISCNTIEIELPDSTRYITRETALDYIEHRFERHIGKRLDEIDLYKIEHFFEGKDCIEDAQAWITDDGHLHIRLRQRRAALKIVGGREPLYIDGDGVAFCSLSDYEADVPEIRGDASITLRRDWVISTVALVEALSTKEPFRGKVVGYSMEPGGYLHIHLKGGCDVYAGQPMDYGTILYKMEQYISNIERIHSNRYYKHVDLSYKGQIICRRNS